MKLFHCIVVMGAAMGSGCGGRATPGAPSPSGGGGGSGAGGSLGAAGEDAGDDAGCPDASPGSSSIFLFGSQGCQNRGPCIGTPDDPQGPAACMAPQQLACGTRAQMLGVTSPHGCACVAPSPLSPADCAQPYQFQCDDWTLPCGCWCDPGAPAAAGECGDASTYPGKQYVCHAYSPPVGCECRVIPPPIL